MDKNLALWIAEVNARLETIAIETTEIRRLIKELESANSATEQEGEE